MSQRIKLYNLLLLFFLFIYFFLFNALFAIPLPPKTSNQKVNKENKLAEKQTNTLKELLPDKSIAPNINGKIFYNKTDSLLTEENFVKKLQTHYVNYKNNITVLVFWETQCGFCQLILPKLELLHKKFASKGINFYAVNPKDLKLKNNLISFFNKYKYSKVNLDENAQKIQVEIDTTQNKELTIPILFVDNTTQQNFLVTGFPTTYVIDEEGLVYTAMIGYFKEYDEWMSMLLNNMLITK